MLAKIIKIFQAYLDSRFRGNDGRKQGSAVVQESLIAKPVKVAEG